MKHENPRIVLAGSVNSSRKTLEKLFQHKMNVVGVLGLAPEVSVNVSGYVDLKKQVNNQNVKFSYFTKINSETSVKFVRECKPDFFFVVGLSQLVNKELLEIPTVGCVGFHPTKLPEGRGRAAVAWLILGKAPGAATFFEMGEGMDDGPILAQQPFEISKNDYAQDVIDKITDKIGDCLDNLLPAMQSGTIRPLKQDHSKATYLGKRNPEDGLICWENPASEINALVRAVSSPLPGAYSFYDGKEVVIDRASAENEIEYVGVAGRIIKIDPNKGVLVCTGDGSIWIKEVRGTSFGNFRVGQTFRSESYASIESLKDEIKKLKIRLADGE